MTGKASCLQVDIFGTSDRARPRGAANSSRFSNAALDTLTEQAAATLDDERREVMMREATRMVTTEHQAMIPLSQPANVRATRHGMTHDARMLKRTTAIGVRPAN